MIWMALIILMFSATAASAGQSFLVMAKNVDWSCLKFQVLGGCSEPAPGVRIRYWEPALVMETVNQPGDVAITEMGPILKPLVKLTSPGPGAHGWQSIGNSNLHFHEVHLYDFPLKLFNDVVLCPGLPNATLGIRYLSELDHYQWRRETRRPLIPVGSWGHLYPRTGFIVAASHAVSSAIDSLRAISAASDILSTPHIVVALLDYQVNLLTDKMQMIYPEKSMCMAPGTPAQVWEPGRVSRDGKYVWVYWRFRECCKPVIPPP